MNDAPEILVTIHIRLPRLDSRALAGHIAPMIVEGLALGGLSCNVSVLPYDPDAPDPE